MKRIILYPLMTVLLIGVAGQMAMTQVVRKKLDHQLVAPQTLAAINTNELMNIARTSREIDEKTALNLVWRLPLVQKKAQEIESLSRRTIKVSALIDSVPSPNEPYYTVRVFEDDPNNYNFTIYWFRVHSFSGEIEALDMVDNQYVSLKEWQEQIRRRR